MLRPTRIRIYAISCEECWSSIRRVEGRPRTACKQHFSAVPLSPKLLLVSFYFFASYIASCTARCTRKLIERAHRHRAGAINQSRMRFSYQSAFQAFHETTIAPPALLQAPAKCAHPHLVLLLNACAFSSIYNTNIRRRVPRLTSTGSHLTSAYLGTAAATGTEGCDDAHNDHVPLPKRGASDASATAEIKPRGGQEGTAGTPSSTRPSRTDALKQQQQQQQQPKQPKPQPEQQLSRLPLKPVPLRTTPSEDPEQRRRDEENKAQLGKTGYVLKRVAEIESQEEGARAKKAQSPGSTPSPSAGKKEAFLLSAIGATAGLSKGKT